MEKSSEKKIDISCTDSRALGPHEEIIFDNGMLSRSRHGRLLIGIDKKIENFVGVSIPGVAVVLASNYHKNGKWSKTTYRIRLAVGAWYIHTTQDFDDRDYFHGHHQTWESVVSYFRAAGCLAANEDIIRFLKDNFQSVAKDITDRAEALSTL